MLDRLFEDKTKREKIDDMVRILKLKGLMKKMPPAVGGFGRDWYSPSFLFRGDGKRNGRGQYVKLPEKANWVYKNNSHLRGGKPTKTAGPWNYKYPRGPGAKFQENLASITYSAIPIHGTKYKWARIENNRLANGYYSQADLNNMDMNLSLSLVIKELMKLWHIVEK